MAFRVEITARAKQDADAILEWLESQHAGDAGLRWFRKLEEAIASLAAFPVRCNLAPENCSYMAFETRHFLFGHSPHVYRILFTIGNNTVYVLHIRHGRRRRLIRYSARVKCQKKDGSALEFRRAAGCNVSRRLGETRGSVPITSRTGFALLISNGTWDTVSVSGLRT
jgi:plasmid stabilization system protein ParE